MFFRGGQSNPIRYQLFVGAVGRLFSFSFQRRLPMAIKKFSSRDRKQLIRFASTLQKGSEERRAILAGLREAGPRLPGAFLRDAQKLSEYKRFVRAVDNSGDLEAHIEKAFKEWVDGLSKNDFLDADEDGIRSHIPSGPELLDLLGDGIGYVIFSEGLRDLTRPIKALEDALERLAKEKYGLLDADGGDLLEELFEEVLESLLIERLEKTYTPDFWRDSIEEAAESFLEEEEDPYSYRY